MTSFHCRAEARPSSTHYLTALLEQSEGRDTPPQWAKASNTISPWVSPVTPGRRDGKRGRRRSAKRDVNSVAPTSPGRKKSSPGASPERRRRKPAMVPRPCYSYANQKLSKFHGVLNSLLSSEREQHVDDPGFQHLDDSGDYIEHYRSARQPPPSTNTVNRRPHTSPDAATDKPNRPRDNEPEESKKTCSRADKGCPHHVPKSPCVKTGQSESSSARAATHVTSAGKIAIKGRHMESSRGIKAAEAIRARKTFCFGKGRKEIFLETAKCKRIRVTWRQYLKYFSRRTTDGLRSKRDSFDKERDNTRGYTERPATPIRGTTTPRGPGLDCDLSRVGTPRTPNRAPPSPCGPVLDCDISRVGTPRNRNFVPADKRGNSARSPREFESMGYSAERCHLNSQRPHTDKEARNQLYYKDYSRDVFVRPATRLSICSVVDIQEAIADLAVSLGYSSRGKRGEQAPK